MSDPHAEIPRRRGEWHLRVWRIAAPAILSNVSVPLVGATDAAVIGQIPDAAYLAAVGLGAQIFTLLFWSFGFLRMSTVGLTAQAWGADDRDELAAVLGNALMLGLALGLLLIALQWPIRLAAFEIFEAEPRVTQLAGTYFDIRIWAGPGSLVNYAVVGWLVGVQRVTLALMLQILLNGTNILLDLVFVPGLGWGVAGVAWASVIAETLAAGVGVWVVTAGAHRLGGRFAAARLFDRARLVALFRVNLDIFIRTICLIFAFTWFTRQSAQLGTLTLAANTVLLQFQTVMAYALDGFATACETLVGAAIGRRDRAALRSAVTTAGLWGIGFAGVFCVFYGALGPSIVDMFTADPAARATARLYLIWTIVTPLVSVWSFLLDGIFIGATRTPEMRNGMLVSLAVFLAGVHLLMPAFGNHGLWAALMIWLGVRAVTLALWYPRIERQAAGARLATRAPGR